MLLHPLCLCVALGDARAGRAAPSAPPRHAADPSDVLNLNTERAAAPALLPSYWKRAVGGAVGVRPAALLLGCGLCFF